MTSHGELLANMMSVLRRRLGDRVGAFAFPPPVFEDMEGEFTALDLGAGTLCVRFPVRERYLNPYGMMQGGVVAAAVDNTIGPLSVLVAPPNVTRRLEMTFSRPVTPEMGYLVVTARWVAQEGQQYVFRADVRSPDGTRLARARAVHWVSADLPAERVEHE